MKAIWIHYVSITKAPQQVLLRGEGRESMKNESKQ